MQFRLREPERLRILPEQQCSLQRIIILPVRCLMLFEEWECSVQTVAETERNEGMKYG